MQGCQYEDGGLLGGLYPPSPKALSVISVFTHCPHFDSIRGAARKISWGCCVSCCRVGNVDLNVIKLLRPSLFLNRALSQVLAH